MEKTLNCLSQIWIEVNGLLRHLWFQTYIFWICGCILEQFERGSVVKMTAEFLWTVEIVWEIFGFLRDRWQILEFIENVSISDPITYSHNNNYFITFSVGTRNKNAEILKLKIKLNALYSRRAHEQNQTIFIRFSIYFENHWVFQHILISIKLRFNKKKKLIETSF